MKKTRSKAGFTLMESLATLFALSIVLLAYVGLRNMMGRTLSETQVRSSLEIIRNDLRSRVKDADQLCVNLYENYLQQKNNLLTLGSAKWTGLGCVWNRVSYLATTSGDPTSPQPQSLICNQRSFPSINTGWWDPNPSQGCIVQASDGNPWPGGQFSSNHCDATHGCPFILYDETSVISGGSPEPYYDPSNSAAGFGLDGTPCQSFDGNNGNSSCPFRYALSWQLECASGDLPTGYCSCHTVVVNAQLQVKFPANDASGMQWVNNLNKQDPTNPNSGNTEVGFPAIRIPIERCSSS
jgi:prepilin-type N-terminal cleavage/methylation domain-containing protein